MYKTRKDSQNQVCVKEAMVSPTNTVARRISNQLFVSFNGARKDHRFVSINVNKARITMKYVENIPRATTWCGSNIAFVLQFHLTYIIVHMLQKKSSPHASGN
jgi:hypothetical protein